MENLQNMVGVSTLQKYLAAYLEPSWFMNYDTTQELKHGE